MENFVKAINKESAAFVFLIQKFLQFSEAKFYAGYFDGPQIKSLMKDEQFHRTMSETKRNVQKTFKSVVNNYLGNCSSSEYGYIIEELMQRLKNMC